MNFVKFSTTPEEFPYEEGCYLDFAVSLDINVYQQQEYLSFNIKDVRPSGFDTEKAMLELQTYEQYQKGIVSPKVIDYYPSREEFAALYRYLRQHPRQLYTIDSLLSAIGLPTLGAFKLLIILDIMQEMKLIRYRRSGDELRVQREEVRGKVDLESSVIYRKLKEVISHVGNHP